jgi:hypothetical protein
MDPQSPTSPPARKAEPPAEKIEPAPQTDLDREIDEELDGTFPASDPLPWSHEVK